MGNTEVRKLESLGFEAARNREDLQAGELVTVELATGRGFVKACARVLRVMPGDDVQIKVVGLEVPYPYHVGDIVVVHGEHVVDWDGNDGWKPEHAQAVRNLLSNSRKA